MRHSTELPLYPEVPAVYFLLHDNRVVYVGQTANLRNAFQISRHADKTFNRVTYVGVRQADLDEVEMACIVFFKPKYNRKRHTKQITLKEAEDRTRSVLSEDDLALLGIERRVPCKYEYDYARPAVTVDCVVFGFDLGAKDPLKILLVQRKGPPYENCWALPGGFVNVDDTSFCGGESLERAVQRELREETGLEIILATDVRGSTKDHVTMGGERWVPAHGGLARDDEPDRVPAHLEQLYTFGAPGRDPRGRVISVAYFVLVRAKDYKPEGGSDASQALWIGASDALNRQLAFDHREILIKALTRVQNKIRYEPIGFNLLPPEFTLTDLRMLYEGLLQRELDPSNFRKRVLATGVLVETGEIAQGIGRPAQLYRFNRTAYDRAVKTGFNFEI